MKHNITSKFNQVFNIIFINIFIAHFTHGLLQVQIDKDKHGK